MFKAKSTKKALFASAISLIICFTMLLGTTFAWFTDSVESGRNTIVAGNLDVELEYSTDGENWTVVDENTKVFGNGSLWEPGHVEAVALRVSNKGTLALKYALSSVVYKEVGSINVDNEPFKLSDHLVVRGITMDTGAIGDALAKYYLGSRPAAQALSSEFDFGENFANDEFLAANSSKYFILAIEMPESVGNEANYKTGETAPSIEFGINLYATQIPYEEDSFGNDYDKIATVSTEAELRDALAAGGEVMLFSDIAVDADNAIVIPNGISTTLNLNGFAITAEGTEAKATYVIDNKGTLTINDKTDEGKIALTNAVVSASYGYATNAIMNNGTLTVNGGIIENNLSGASYAIDNNVGATATVNGGSVINTKGTAIRAYSWDANKASTVVINGGTVKGAYAVRLNNLSTTVKGKINLAVNGGTIYGTNGWALYSYCHDGSNFNIALNGGEYYGYVGFGGGNKAGVETVAIDEANCTFYGDVFRYTSTGSEDLVSATAGATAASQDDLASALGSGKDVVYLAAGTYTFPASSFQAGTTLICDDSAVFDGTSSLNINGATVVGATFSSDNERTTTGTVNGTYKDCVFEGNRALRYCYAGETVVFENCVFDGSVYGVHFDGGANDVVFKNCTFSGFNAFGAALTQLTLEDCTFKSTGKSSYNGVNLWGNTELKNCTFVFDGAASTEWIGLNGADSKTITFTDCTVTNGELADYFSNWSAGDKVIVDGVEVVNA